MHDHNSPPGGDKREDNLSHHLRGLQGAVIDLDGTLVDTTGDFVCAINLMLDDLSLEPGLGRHVDAQVVEKMVGKGSEHLVRSVLEYFLNPAGRLSHTSDTDRIFDIAIASYQKHYATVNGRHALVYDGVLEGLKHLHEAGLKLACLTNKPTAFAIALLRVLKLDAFFTVVFGGDAFEKKKPDPLPLVRTCEALGCLPSHTLMIGDSSNDARAARGAGCPVVLVTYGYNHGEPVHLVDADGFIDSLADLRLPA